MRHDYEPFLARRDWDPLELDAIGFFDDGLTLPQLNKALNDKRWVTPISHLASSGIVLCMTGAFSPFHAGHLRALEIAKREIESRGLTVAGALVQPDHDGYVSTKRGGVCACDASTRIHLAQEGTKHADWIAVDPWAALYQDRPLNYTTILRRTERYLGPDYQVVFVFGSDNAGFKDAFLPHEYVCVGRPGYEEPHPEAYDMSSTRQRELEQRHLKIGHHPTLQYPYLIRADLKWATQDWDVPATVLADFELNLSAAFKSVWGHTPFFIDSEYQRAELAKANVPFISFDRVTGAEHWVSRVFDPCTHQHRPARWISSDLLRIPSGEHVFIDDDIASGSTFEYVKSQTPQVKWVDAISMTKWSVPTFFDIVDARDFLFGSKLGGLCIADGDQTYRAPYITPWVNLTQRAKIPPHKQVRFVRDVIEANARFFLAVYTTTDHVITVGDTDNQAFWQHLGYSLDVSMRYVSMDLLSWNPN